MVFPMDPSHGAAPGPQLCTDTCPGQVSVVRRLLAQSWGLSPNTSKCLSEGTPGTEPPNVSLGGGASGAESQRETSPATGCGLGSEKGLL